MKGENDFNAHLSRGLKKLYKNGFSYLKASDRFSSGVSDFLLWHMGRSAAIESKFIEDFPARPNTKILSHAFQGAQMSFFKRMEPGGAGLYGLIGIKKHKVMILVPHHQIPEEGNWTKAQFLKELSSGMFISFYMDDIGQMAFIAIMQQRLRLMQQQLTEGLTYNITTPGQIDWNNYGRAQPFR